MKKKGTRIPGRILCCLIFPVILGIGCTYQRQHSFESVGMPETVYIQIPVRKHYRPDIAVIPFRSDGYTWQVGENASRLLFLEMLKFGLNADVVFTDSAGAMDAGSLASFSRKNRYDYIVTGDVLYFLNGGSTTQSRVEEEIKVYSVSGEELQAVGYAKAVETAFPLPDIDYYLVKGRGASAPSAETLMERNAGKFARFLADMFSREKTIR